jgi:protoheme IX farnesyltransferase
MNERSAAELTGPALAAEPPALGRVADLWELVKPRITTMVVVTAAGGAYLAGQVLPPLPLLIATLVGTGFVAGGASAVNQVIERDRDALMRRTAERPLPAGRISREAALLFASAVTLIGMIALTVGTNLLTAFIAALSFALYVFVYTPLKRRTSLATVVGAVPGALPPVMGWTAVAGQLDPGAAALFGILFLWQLPHFLAIAWLCRDDYAAAGFPMLPVVEPDGNSTGRQAALYAATLIPVSLLPVLLGLAGSVYFWGALALGLGFLGTSVAFSRALSLTSARRLLLTSVAYLPALLAAMVVDSLV